MSVPASPGHAGPDRPEDVQASRLAAMVDEWARAGVRHAVVCPGSRSTPLALALAADGRLRVHVRLDERSAGFTAVGIGMAGAGPAVVCTTSGTATAELHAAVLEAHHGQVPLLVCTADRPPELHDVGAPQTVDQRDLYGGAVRWSVDAGVADLASAAAWRSLAARAVAETRANPAGPGPVHCNLPFREPLVGRPTRVPAGRPGGEPWHRLHAPRAVGGATVADDLALLGVTGTGGGGAVAPTDGVVVAGAGCGDPEAVLGLAGVLGWPVLADPRSGCRRPGPGVVVATADAVLRHGPSVAALRPTAVLRLGRPWASKVVNEWLDRLGPSVPQLSVTAGWPGDDPGRSVARTTVGDPGDWCRVAVERAGRAPVWRRPPTGSWAARWASAERAARAALEQWLVAHPEATEPGVAHAVLAGVPRGTAVFLASSMPVRDAEWYGPVRPDHPPVHANRGANGIDGVVSTALGVALTGVPVAAVVGDLAFLHDLTAWVRPPGPGPDCTVVVVDNGGGGIFSFLPQARGLADDLFARLFATPQAVDVVRVARGLDVAVTEVDDLAALAHVLGGVPGGGLRVARVRVPDHRANVALHDEVHAAVAAALDRALQGRAGEDGGRG